MRARGTWLAAAVFVSVAIAMTGIVRASGRQIVDTGRYSEYAESLQSDLVPYRDFDLEYPPGALALFVLPALVVSGESTYFWAFAALMAVAGAAGLILTAGALERLGRPPAARRLVLWLLALSPLLFGGVLLTRFDLVPAALVAGTTLLVLVERPRVAAVVLGIAAAVKLYPLLLLPLLALWAWRRFGRREATLASALALAVVVLAYAPFALVSPDGVAQSVWRQLSRPLQIEGLGAGVLVLLHHAFGFDLVVETDYGSQNLGGTPATVMAVACSLVGAAAILGLWIAFARSKATNERLVLYAAAVLVAFVAFGKVLSPQFLVWLLFPLALVPGRRGSAAGACLAVAAVATAVWFPWLYFDLTRELDPLVAGLVVLRGVALGVAFVALSWPTATKPQSSPRPRAAAVG
ncbi:MAG TPA: glycosyltransferase family 87 protein [Gaiellaceae bacterium]|nr:glycosyltransferase family 87 protein [Gaiellaceae bacterium]